MILKNLTYLVFTVLFSLNTFANHNGVEGGDANGRATDPTTKVKCIPVVADKTKALYVSTVQGSASPNGGRTQATYKVVMTVKNQPNWEEFKDYQAAKDFADQLSKTGVYSICTFTPTSGKSWTEVVVNRFTSAQPYEN
jgi:hypothetical protein